MRDEPVFIDLGKKGHLMRNAPTVCGKSYEEFYQTIERFHGWKAPGVVIGGFMVDFAQEQIGPGVEADAIVEIPQPSQSERRLRRQCQLRRRKAQSSR
jgi:hypothetical protein